MFKTFKITNDTDCFTTSISRYTGKTAIRQGPGSIMAGFCPYSPLLDFSYHKIAENVLFLKLIH